MLQLEKISDVKPFQKPQDSIFSTLINRKFSRIFSYFIVKYTKIGPTFVNFLSLFVSLAGCAMFLHPNYWVRFAGIFVLQIGFTFDCADGEVARMRNVANAFGAWIDSVMDRFKEFAMLGAMTWFWYDQVQTEVWVLVVGFLAIIGLEMVSYLREAKKSSWPSKRTAEMHIAKNIYLGTVDITIYMVCFGVLIHQEIWILGAFLLASLPLIFKQLLSAYRLSKQ
jgi:phosphatidylglycerophosphate synthase